MSKLGAHTAAGIACSTRCRGRLDHLRAV